MAELALSDLNPTFRRVHADFTPETGGVATDEFDLTFRCPSCGPPAVIAIRVGPNMKDAPPHRVWQAMPPFPGHVDEWAKVLTLAPSIDHTGAGHGKRRPVCSFHGHISNGKVIFP